MELVTMGEAAHCLGISVDTVRGCLRRGELLGHYQPTPEGIIWWVEIPEQFGPCMTLGAGAGGPRSTLADAAAGPAFTLTSTPSGVSLPAGGVRALRELMDALRHETDAKDRSLASEDRKIDRLRLLLQQAIDAPSPPGRNRASNSQTPTVDSILDE
ncbi:MAG: hypothetical protein QGI50_02635 [Dehalococcoidia bacterium]|nr:hypothetical protein [Dehalococcoidia bacterium]MDP7199842.1 hypothetical protein [Dehalococcoidia bacterium]HJN87515.1 hypothetical protein [Dehalococcoidia bacterium]